jgi:carboxymethylenebutenolidase
VTDDPSSPHLLADRMKATVYVAGAENDPGFTTDHAETLEKALSAAGVKHTVEFYPAAPGFAVPDNPPYDEEAAERHWIALQELFETALA